MNKPLFLQLDQWKIGTKLGVGFSVVLFLFILVSLLNWQGRNDNQRAFVLYSQASAASTAILELNHQISDLRSAILAYSQTGHKSGVARIEGLYAKVKESLASKHLVFNDAERQRILVRMNAVLSTYNENIDTLFADREQYDQYTRVILPQAANNVRATLERLSKFTENNNYPELQLSIEQCSENFLRALVDANSFFAVRDHDLQRSAKASLTNAVKIWAKMQIPKNADELQDLAKNLGVAINDYSTGFDNALQVTRGYLFLVNVVIPGEAAEFENLSLNLKALTLKDLKEVSESTERDIKDNQKKISIITAMGICLGVILAFLISKGIVRPLQEISSTFRQLVKREQVENIPGLNRKDEIGQLAKAADVFREISENRFQSIFNEAPIGIALIDSLTGHIRELNPKFAEIAGRPLTEMTEIDWMSITHPDDVQEDLDNMDLLNAGEISSFTMNKRYIRPDGSHVWINMSIVPVSVDEKSAPCHLCMIENITDRLEEQKKQQQLEEQLHQSQKIESVGRLAGGVAHDYNNMLSVIIGNTELAQMKAKRSAPLDDNLEYILQAANRSRDITRQLLAFARKQIINPEVSDLNVIVENMLRMLGSLLGEDIDLRWQPKADLWQVKIDPSQLDQVLANLCINARDAITENGKITIATATVSLDEEYCKDHPDFICGNYVVLSVTDNGCGMDKETLANVFEPFFTTKKTGEGTGLGMATVYGIVKQSGGFINAYSEPNQGTTFKIYFPRHEEEAVVSQETTVSKVQKGQGETVLLVEDEKAIVKLATAMLEDLGYRVLPTNSPVEALNLLKEFQGDIHLLLTDVVMPGMNGRELAKQVQDIHPKMKALYMSGYTANVIAHHGVLDEGINFIQKPFSRHDLSLRVREILDSNA